MTSAAAQGRARAELDYKDRYRPSAYEMSLRSDAWLEAYRNRIRELEGRYREYDVMIEIRVIADTPELARQKVNRLVKVSHRFVGATSARTGLSDDDSEAQADTAERLAQFALPGDPA